MDKFQFDSILLDDMPEKTYDQAAVNILCRQTRNAALFIGGIIGFNLGAWFGVSQDITYEQREDVCIDVVFTLQEIGAMPTMPDENDFDFCQAYINDFKAFEQGP